MPTLYADPNVGVCNLPHFNHHAHSKISQPSPKLEYDKYDWFVLLPHYYWHLGHFLVTLSPKYAPAKNTTDIITISHGRYARNFHHLGVELLPEQNVDC